jgi:hypothetical protein
MKRSLYVLFFAVLALAIITGCRDKKTPEIPPQQPPPPPPAAASGYTGTVKETMTTAGYTYVRVDTAKGKIWAAAPEFPVKVGDKVTVPPGAAMKNYQSKTLNRTFDLVYFVSGITVGNDKQPAPQGQAAAMAKKPALEPVKVDISGIKKPEGGKTVAELYAEKNDLSGKQVTVRGQVVKYSPQIMGKNWVHLQDGSGAEGTNDLTITSGTAVKEGDTILVSGMLVLDKDFGYGYKYAVIIEDAEITVE